MADMTLEEFDKITENYDRPGLFNLGQILGNQFAGFFMNQDGEVLNSNRTPGTGFGYIGDSMGEKIALAIGLFVGGPVGWGVNIGARINNGIAISKTVEQQTGIKMNPVEVFVASLNPDLGISMFSKRNSEENSVPVGLYDKVMGELKTNSNTFLGGLLGNIRGGQQQQSGGAAPQVTGEGLLGQHQAAMSQYNGSVGRFNGSQVKAHDLGNGQVAYSSVGRDGSRIVTNQYGVTTFTDRNGNTSNTVGGQRITPGSFIGRGVRGTTPSQVTQTPQVPQEEQLPQPNGVTGVPAQSLPDMMRSGGFATTPTPMAPAPMPSQTPVVPSDPYAGNTGQRMGNLNLVDQGAWQTENFAGRNRSNTPSSSFMDRALGIVQDKFGPAASAHVFSGWGVGAKGKERHRDENAMDVVFSIDGKPISMQNDMGAYVGLAADLFSQGFSVGLGGAATGYMGVSEGFREGAIHVDLPNKDVGKGGHYVWGGTSTSIAGLPPEVLGAFAKAVQTKAATDPVAAKAWKDLQTQAAGKSINLQKAITLAESTRTSVPGSVGLNTSLADRAVAVAWGQKSAQDAVANGFLPTPRPDPNVAPVSPVETPPASQSLPEMMGQQGFATTPNPNVGYDIRPEPAQSLPNMMESGGFATTPQRSIYDSARITTVPGTQPTIVDRYYQGQVPQSTGGPARYQSSGPVAPANPHTNFDPNTGRPVPGNFDVPKSVVDTILGEAKAGDLNDMSHIASVIDNRAKSMGVSPTQIVATEFDAYGKSLPKGVEQYRDLATQAYIDVMTKGPVTNATHYATPAATGNLFAGTKGKLEQVGKTAGHQYYTVTDPNKQRIGYVDEAGKTRYSIPDLSKIQVRDTQVASNNASNLILSPDQFFTDNVVDQTQWSRMDKFMHGVEQAFSDKDKFSTQKQLDDYNKNTIYKDDSENTKNMGGLLDSFKDYTSARQFDPQRTQDYKTAGKQFLALYDDTRKSIESLQKNTADDTLTPEIEAFLSNRIEKNREDMGKLFDKRLSFEEDKDKHELGLNKDQLLKDYTDQITYEINNLNTSQQVMNNLANSGTFTPESRAYIQNQMDQSRNNLNRYTEKYLQIQNDILPMYEDFTDSLLDIPESPPAEAPENQQAPDYSQPDFDAPDSNNGPDYSGPEYSGPSFSSPEYGGGPQFSGFDYSGPGFGGYTPSPDQDNDTYTGGAFGGAPYGGF